MNPQHDAVGTTTAEPLSHTGLLKLAPAMFAIAIGCAVVSTLLSLVPLWCIYKIAQTLLSTEPDALTALNWGLAALGAVMLRWLIMTVSHVTAHLAAFELLRQLRSRIARHLGEVPLSFFNRHSSTDLRRTINDDVGSLEGFFAHSLPDSIAAAVMPPLTLIVLLCIDWRLALACIAPLPLAFLAQMLMVKGSAERMAKWQSLQQQISQSFSEYLQGIQVVKSFGLTSLRFGTLSKDIRGAAEWVAGFARKSSLFWVVFSGLLSANLIIVAPLGAGLLLAGKITLETLLLFLLLAPAVLMPLLRLTYMLGDQVQRNAALARINEVLLSPAMSENPDARIPDAPLDLRLENVCHAYGERKALDQVSFSAQAGQLTALVGPSGSGKSTIAQLVCRLFDADSGSITLGGTDLRDWPLEPLLERVASVFQQVHLFDGTVLDNLLLARPDADQASVEAATRAACAHDFIQRLPQGYQTRIGEGGAQLSGGERQRLSIARALLKNAPVLILDEATAYADSENEALIQEALANLCRGRTVLMIAHRLHTVTAAQRIVVLDQGQVRGIGRHEELLAGCPLYQQLWQDHTRIRQWQLSSTGVSA
ncbi:ABC transporter ATP-binding protein/permease [Pseudomonas cichorii]|nr:ABC transporter ATP-binding protein [Pseudomonas cichorii]MBX8490940.1 ABC transporter ATP-binding protein/permease [Pseudomonas cichorii]MBX8518387.1 ABC transporter ATP-binding protein/permease [Pseudomonas cichorii]MBX8546132.1 ABC transporter ATP-binding protein/permease [Pseudomonas cichorii]MBX8548738.1 ABC transporter ATP-binding protein/permease [Pseudomonas cichorii]MBX8569400.1 ABC transporter ATP-binding protein/permease [Pseudomonas cichorii]